MTRGSKARYPAPAGVWDAERRDRAGTLCNEAQHASRCRGRRRVRDWLGDAGACKALFPWRSATTTPVPIQAGSPSTSSRERGCDPRTTARKVSRHPAGEGRVLHVLRPFLQTLPRVHRVQTGRGPRRPQGGPHHGGRLGRVDDGTCRPDRRRGVEGLPVCGPPTFQPPVPRRTDTGYEAERPATLSRARHLPLRRLYAPRRVRQSQSRRQALS